MKEKKLKWVVTLLTLVLIAVVVDITVRQLVSTKPEPSLQYSKMLIKIGMEDPDCANKLLKAANLTNIHIVPSGTLDARRDRESIASKKD